MVMAVAAVFFALHVLILPVGVIAIWFFGEQEERELAPFLAMAIPVYAAAALFFFWLARRLLRGERAANGVTVLPLWFIQISGALLLVGMLFNAYSVYVKRDPEIPEYAVLGFTTFITISISMMIVPWLVRRRLRTGGSRLGR